MSRSASTKRPVKKAVNAAVIHAKSWSYKQVQHMQTIQTLACYTSSSAAQGYSRLDGNNDGNILSMERASSVSYLLVKNAVDLADLFANRAFEGVFMRFLAAHNRNRSV